MRAPSGDLKIQTQARKDPFNIYVISLHLVVFMHYFFCIYHFSTLQAVILHQSQWCNLLYHIKFAINSTVAETTSHSPFEMVHGEQVRLPIDVIVCTQGKMLNATHFTQNIQQVV